MNDDLPPLPEPDLQCLTGFDKSGREVYAPAYSAEATQAYARAALAAAHPAQAEPVDDEVDVLATYSRSDGQREWVDVGCWLLPGEEIVHRAALAAAQPAQAEPVELSPEFTDTSRAALLWVLWHHQGSSSGVGQAMRFALGMGRHDRLTEHQVAEAKRWAELAPPQPAWHEEPAPDGWRLVPTKLTPELRDALLSCESGEFSLQGGWDYILASCPQPPTKQPVEPVVWIKPGALDFVQEEGEGLVSLRVEDNGGRIPLYTAPPQPMTLSDEQIDAACKTVPAAVYELMHGHEITLPVFRQALREVARAVLAAAQEKQT